MWEQCGRNITDGFGHFRGFNCKKILIFTGFVGLFGEKYSIFNIAILKSLIALKFICFEI
jgi:hypothetical protein